MLKVGVTGGIGSGKTLVTRIFNILGIPVYNADEASKHLLQHNHALKLALINHFGPQVYTEGQLNKPWLAERVFGNPTELQQLNAIVHPVVIADANNWMLQQNAPYAIKEAAIFFESGSHKKMDYMVGVYAPVQIRIDRVVKRNGLSIDDIKKRMSQQMNEEEKMKLCDVVLFNDGSQMLIPQVLKIHEALLEKARTV